MKALLGQSFFRFPYQSISVVFCWAQLIPCRSSLYNKILMRKRPQWGRMKEIESLSQSPAKQPFILRTGKGTIHRSAHQPTRNNVRPRLPTQPNMEALAMAALEEELRMMTGKHCAEVARLNQVRERREWQLRDVQEQQRATKMEIWQLRNEALELKQAIQMQKEEMEELQRSLLPQHPHPHPPQQQPQP